MEVNLLSYYTKITFTCFILELALDEALVLANEIAKYSVTTIKAYMDKLGATYNDQDNENYRIWIVLSATMEWAMKHEIGKESSKKSLAMKLLKLHDDLKDESVRFDQLAKHLDLQGNDHISMCYNILQILFSSHK